MAELTGSIASDVALQDGETLLVARLKEGDEAAFAEVFHLYKNLVYNLSWKMLADKAEAMDVTQEVFVTLYRKIDRFRGECTLKTWLYRVALNQAANRNRWWKRRLRHRTLSLGLALNGHASAAELPCDGPGSDRRFFAVEIQEALQESLKCLPFEQRAAVIMRDVEGLSYEEIAEVMGVQMGTVKSRIARGREMLRKLLKPYREGYRP